MEEVGAQVAAPMYVHSALPSRYCEAPPMAKKRDYLYHQYQPEQMQQQIPQIQDLRDNWSPSSWNWDNVSFVAKPLESAILRPGMATAEHKNKERANGLEKNGVGDEADENLRLNLGGGLKYVEEPVSRAPKRVRSGSPGGNYPMCQVDDCDEDLSNAKDYHRRHKVCELHSKSAKAPVGKQMQRFCQQCSRFHQLNEFDQGKRSCRRRLAGHNERRRKPPPGSAHYSRHSRFSSSIFDNSTGSAGLVMDFSAYPGPPPREAWIAPQASNRGPGNQTLGREKLQLHPPWQSSPESHQYNLFLQGPSPSVGGTSFPGPGIPPGESFNPSCALSLLSNQQPDSASQASGRALNSNVLSPQASVGAQVINPLDAAVGNFSSASWALKVNEAGGSTPDIAPDLGLGHVSQPLNGPFSSGLEFSLQSRRQNTDQDHSQDYNSTQQQRHWSL